MAASARLRMVMLCVAWAWSGATWAGLPETPQPRQIGVVDGLPSNRINSITQDAQGYLWVATSDGLARYDGIDYRVWRTEQGLRDPVAWTAYVDPRNRIWVGTDSAGIAILDGDRGGFDYIDRANTPSLASNTIWAITGTADGTVWFGTADAGLYRRDPAGKLTRFVHKAGDPRSLPDDGVASLAVTPDGTLWVGTKGGAARWTGRDFERLDAGAGTEGSADSIVAEDDGAVWFGLPSGLVRRSATGVVSTQPLQAYGDMPVYRMLGFEPGDGYWLDIPEGLGRVSDGRIVKVPLYSDAARGEVRPQWSAGYRDRDGGLWLASVANGLWYLPSNWRMFSVLSRRANDEGSPGNAQVRGIAASADGTMWLVGSGGALDRLDPETGEIVTRVHDVGGERVPVGVFEDSRGHVWVGAHGSVALFDADGSPLQRWSHDDEDDAAPADETSQLVETGDHRVWLRARDGSLQVRDLDGRVELDIGTDAERGLQARRRVEQIGLGADGALWAATSQGLMVWNDGGRRFDRVPGGPDWPVSGFAIDRPGGGGGSGVWLSRVGGVQRFAWDGARLTPGQSLGTRIGIPLVTPKGIVVDSAGVVWMTTVRGLLRIDPAQRSARLFGVRDGLPSQEFNDAPVVRPADGRILAGTPDGLVIFDPAVVRPSATAPKLVVESVSVRRDEGRIDLLPGATLAVEHGDRDLRVVARLLSFNGGRGNHYRFHLDGFDSGWVDVGATGERVFSQLHAGRYQLRVVAATADNVWSSPVELSLDVAPAWWRAWWAIALWIALAALAVAMVAHELQVRLRRRNAWQLSRHKRELAEQASLAKTRFLATLGHEVRTPMTGVLGMSELLLSTELDGRQRGYIESIRRAGNHLMRLVNDALDLARIEAGRLELDPQPFDLHALLQEIVALMEPMARQRGLAFHEDVTDAAMADWRLGDAGRVRQILLNLVGNAIKFTEAGEVTVSVSADAHGVQFAVSDTGPGLNAEQQQRLFRRFEQAEGARTSTRYGGSGLGLAICQELAAAMGGRIDVDSTPGVGTRFTVALPLDVAPASASTAVVPARAPSPLTARGALNLLLVEDDPTVAEVIIGLLQAQGHRVVHAAHGLAALVETANSTFDLAMLDLDLPGLDGLALARQLRAQGFTAPLLAVTARADAEAEPLSREAGFAGFLRKPLTGDMLAEAIEALLPPLPSAAAAGAAEPE